jgi:GDP-mannose 6-dehydrogenase
MNIAIFGLGYVGSVSMACFARNGHHVIGVDVNQQKINDIQAGKSPIIEPGLDNLIKSGLESGNIRATNDVALAVDQAEIILITVGTPSKSNGSLETLYVERVCEDIGKELAIRKDYKVVAVRSTILPGIARDILLPLLETSSRKIAGNDFGFCVNPEFLREGSAISDFDQPPYTVIGELDDRSGRTLAQLYDGVAVPIYRVPLGAAEMVKYASNAFHALKVVFANEIGNICQAYSVDSHQVMDIFVKDRRLNLSPYYLKPGFSFGGSCLGKDMRALLYAARNGDLHVPILESVLSSNNMQTQKAVDMVLREGKRKVGIIGLSFKPKTDDLRESPAIELAERLIGKGLDLLIYDREVSLSQIHGSNRDYMERVLPHIGSLLQNSLEDTLNNVDAIVLTKRLSEIERDILIDNIRDDQVVIDLIRIDGQHIDGFDGAYRGICW